MSNTTTTKNETMSKAELWDSLGPWLLSDDGDVVAAWSDVVARVQSAYGKAWRMKRVLRADLVSACEHRDRQQLRDEPTSDRVAAALAAADAILDAVAKVD